MEIRLLSSQIKQLQSHAESIYPEECVGALMGHLHENVVIVSEVRPLKNDWAPVDSSEMGRDRRTRYRVSPSVVLALIREEAKTGTALVGFYHSHPDHEALPSQTDLSESAFGYIYMIQSVVNGKAGVLTAWQIEDDSVGFATVTIGVL